MDPAMVTAISKQINREFYSSYLYLSMAGYADNLNLPGFTNWLHLQASEEKGHAMRMINFVSSRGGRVKLEAIAAPPHEFNSIRDVFQETLDHEKEITGHINDLYALAVEKRDYATQVELQWFINEQVEEEKIAGGILATLNLIKDSAQGLFSLDRQLATRAPATPGAN